MKFEIHDSQIDLLWGGRVLIRGGGGGNLERSILIEKRCRGREA